MSKYKKPKVGFLDHAAGKTGKETNPIDDVLNEAKENPAPTPEPKAEKKPVITENKNPADGMSSYVKATQVDPNSAKGAFDDKAVEGYVPPILEEKKPEVDPQKMSAYQKAVHERSVKEKQKMQEAADLLGGEIEKPVTQADLKQIKVSLASLGGGGLGERDVINLIKKYGADSIGSLLDSGQIQQIIDAFRPLNDTDSLPEGLNNLYYTDARVDSNFALKTTDDLAEGTTNLYFTEDRARQSIQSIDSALQYDQLTGNIALDTNFIDTYNSDDFDSDLASKTTDDLTEGTTNLYYTDERVEALVDSAYVQSRQEDIYRDSAFVTNIVDSDYINARVDTQVLSTTDSLPEGILNLYYTDSRSRSAIQSIDSALIYEETTGNLSLAIDPNEFYTTVDFDSDFLTKTTDSLAEGADNLYFQEERVQHMYYWAKAIEDIALGDVVQFAGAQGSHLLIRKADQTLAGFEPHHVMGVAKEAILDQQFGYVAAFGQVRHINVGTFSDGDILYLDPTTPGGFTDSKPMPPNHAIQIAAVTDDNPSNNGTIQVRLNHLPDTDEVPEGLTNLYYTTARFDSDASGINSKLDSLEDRLDSDDIEIQTLKNKVDQLDLSSAIQIQYNKILSYDSATDSVPVGFYGLHFDGTGTEYNNIDKLFIHHTDRNGVHVPFGIIDSGDTIIIADSDGGLGRFQVDAFEDRGNHHEFDVSVQAGQGAPADLAAMKIFPEQNLNALASMDYVDAQDKILQDQINELDSAIDSEHAWNVAEHAALDSDLTSRFDSEHAWSIEENRLQDSEFRTKMDSEHAWNVAEHSALDSDKVNRKGDVMTGDLEITHPNQLLTNKVNSVGNSNMSIQRNSTTKIQITSNANKQFQKAVYNSDYGVTDDLDIPHKLYVDNSIVSVVDSAIDELSQEVSDTYLPLIGGTLTGNLDIDSANLNLTDGTMTIKRGDLRVVENGKVASNKISSVGNSNLQLERNGDRKLLIGTNTLIADKKIKYNTNYNRDSYTSDLRGQDSYTLMPKWYIDSAVENASFVFDSSQFVNVTGDSMSGALTIRRPQEGGTHLTIAKGDQDRIRFRNDGKINWTGNATDARLNKDGGDFAISLNGDDFLNFVLNDGKIEVAKTLTLTGSEKVINLPNNSDVGELQSNGNRRLFWDKDNVSIDVPLQMVDQIKLNNTNEGGVFNPDDTQSKITFENTKSDGTTNTSHIFQSGKDNVLITNAKFKTKSNFYTNEYLYGWSGNANTIYHSRIQLLNTRGRLKYGEQTNLYWDTTGVGINNIRGNSSNAHGFTVKGATGDSYSATTVTEEDGDLLQVYHNANATDAVNYYGRIIGDKNIVTKEYVDDQVAGSSAPTNVVIKDGETEVTTAFKILGNSKTFIVNSNNELGLYNLKAPTNSHHATRKAYVDDNFVGLTGNQSVAGEKTFTSSLRLNNYGYLSKSSGNANGLLRRDTIEAMIAAGGGGGADYKITKSGSNYYIEST